MSRIAVIEEIEQQQLKSDLPDFEVGDTIEVKVRIVEGGKERVQTFAGTVIARKGKGISETFSMYRVAYGTAVERVFTLHSPNVVSIKIVKKGKTKRAKLYYLRGLSGKKARIKERIGARVKKEKTPKAAAPVQEEVAKPEEKAESPETQNENPETENKGGEE